MPDPVLIHRKTVWQDASLRIRANAVTSGGTVVTRSNAASAVLSIYKAGNTTTTPSTSVPLDINTVILATALSDWGQEGTYNFDHTIHGDELGGPGQVRLEFHIVVWDAALPGAQENILDAWLIQVRDRRRPSGT